MRTRVVKLFDKHLFWTNTILSSIMMGLGDVIVQKLEMEGKKNSEKEQNKKFNLSRTGEMFVTGFLLGPMQHIFYKMIDERFPAKSARHVGKKILLDQLIASPTYIVGFFLCCGLLEGDIQKSFREMKDKFLTIYKVDCMIWPPTQLINFLYFSPKYRMMYVNATTMVYDVFLSYVKHEENKEEPV